MTLKETGASLVFVAAGIVLGFVLGGFLGSRVFSSGGMGWDQLADTLGGMMLGVLFSFVLLPTLVRRLTVRQRVFWAGAFLLGAVLVMLLMRAHPKRLQAYGLPDVDGANEVAHFVTLVSAGGFRVKISQSAFCQEQGVESSAGIRRKGQKTV